MHRWALAFLVVLVAGCGKSFQEADAIYRDEVAKLEVIESKRDTEFKRLILRHYLKEGSDGEKATFSQDIEGWLRKDVEQAKARFPKAKPDLSKANWFAIAWYDANDLFAAEMKAQEDRVKEAFEVKESAK